MSAGKTSAIGILGGSGFYSFLPHPKAKHIPTPFSHKPVTVFHQSLNTKSVYFIPRHGQEHTIPPHRINFKANVFALKELGVTRALGTAAVGAINPEMQPGDFVVIDQFIDFSHPLSFFDGDLMLKKFDGSDLKGVIHIDMSEPYCPTLRNLFIEQLKESSRSHFSGTYFRTYGPRFETPAEINAIKRMGGDLVGMTNPSEAILCRELGICYAAVSVVTNRAAGLQPELSQKEVIDIFQTRQDELKNLFFHVVDKIDLSLTCSCANHLR
ncbi:MAG: MTAP family purine nucleoside phosphorylase [Candidatus Heimdallarchaeota archaeon]